MDKPMNEIYPAASEEDTREAEVFERFVLTQRIEHLFFLTSFSILGITGLAQKFAESPISLAIMGSLGGVAATRTVHHFSAFVMMWVSVFHLLSVLYRVYVLRVPWSMMPVVDDIKHVIQDVRYYVGLSEQRAFTGRYSYAEKAEYFAVVWGTVVMAITGFMMWNPITTTQFLPGEVIPAAKAAHGAEAVLAVLAILIWHVYHVHVRRFNRSMFIGTLTREEMEDEHPAELEEIDSGRAWKLPPEAEIRQRRKIYLPIAAVTFAALSILVIRFVTIEPATAITTLPQRESVAVFVPVTPTPRPTAAPTATPEGGLPVGADTWAGNYSALFANRCGTCHVRTALGGLSLATYQNALVGGNSGPGIIPGQADNSQVVIIQTAGNHPGQLTAEELQQVIDWIEIGAPEK